MEQIVSITRQGQLTIPKAFRDFFDIKGSVKANIHRQGDEIIVKPKKSFWALAGSLESKISLTDKELKQARQAFSQKWPNP